MLNKHSTKEEVIEAVKQNGWALKYASEELQNDREVVLAAIKRNGVGLGYASDELQLEIINCWVDRMDIKKRP